MKCNIEIKPKLTIDAEYPDATGRALARQLNDYLLDNVKPDRFDECIAAQLDDLSTKIDNLLEIPVSSIIRTELIDKIKKLGQNSRYSTHIRCRRKYAKKRYIKLQVAHV